MKKHFLVMVVVFFGLFTSSCTIYEVTNKSTELDGKPHIVYYLPKNEISIGLIIKTEAIINPYFSNLDSTRIDEALKNSFVNPKDYYSAKPVSKLEKLISREELVPDISKRYYIKILKKRKEQHFKIDNNLLVNTSEASGVSATNEVIDITTTIIAKAAEVFVNPLGLLDISKNKNVQSFKSSPLLPVTLVNTSPPHILYEQNLIKKIAAKTSNDLLMNPTLRSGTSLSIDALIKAEKYDSLVFLNGLKFASHYKSSKISKLDTIWVKVYPAKIPLEPTIVDSFNTKPYQISVKNKDLLSLKKEVNSSSLSGIVYNIPGKTELNLTAVYNSKTLKHKLTFIDPQAGYENSVPAPKSGVSRKVTQIVSLNKYGGLIEYKVNNSKDEDKVNTNISSSIESISSALEKANKSELDKAKEENSLLEEELRRKDLLQKLEQGVSQP